MQAPCTVRWSHMQERAQCIYTPPTPMCMPTLEASTSKRAHELLRFRLGCYTLPSVTRRRAGIPRSERLCPLCMHGAGDEKHLVFGCSALNGIRLRFPHLFTGFHTMSSYMNQAAHTTRRHAFISSLIVCEHSHDNLESGVVPALEPAMLSHSTLLRSPRAAGVWLARGATP